MNHMQMRTCHFIKCHQLYTCSTAASAAAGHGMLQQLCYNNSTGCMPPATAQHCWSDCAALLQLRCSACCCIVAAPLLLTYSTVGSARVVSQPTANMGLIQRRVLRCLLAYQLRVLCPLGFVALVGGHLRWALDVGRVQQLLNADQDLS